MLFRPTSLILVHKKFARPVPQEGLSDIDKEEFNG
jgi:hypothetical protein